MTATRIATAGLDQQYQMLEQAHNLHLAKYGVNLPGANTQQALMLTYLHQKKGQLVALEALRAFVRSHAAEGSQDVQPRHLKYAGWYVLLSGKANDTLLADAEYLDSKGNKQTRLAGEKLPNGYIMLVNDTNPSPSFEVNKRRGTINRDDWTAMLKDYDYCCATCGKKKKQLERGHKDPNKGSDNSNIIPMCSECNNWASNDLVFGDNGRISALASFRFVDKSSLEVKIKIFEALRNDKRVNLGKKR